jgi:hypothetical protein
MQLPSQISRGRINSKGVVAGADIPPYLGVIYSKLQGDPASHFGTQNIKKSHSFFGKEADDAKI